MPTALRQVVKEVNARVLVLSYNDESWMGLDDLVAACQLRGHVAVLGFDSTRYVGARIGIYDPSGRPVGTPGRLRNVEYLLVAGDEATVEHLVAPYAGARITVDGHQEGGNRRPYATGRSRQQWSLHWGVNTRRVAGRLWW